MRGKLSLLIAVAAVAFPASAGAASFGGVVVAKHQARHTIAVAARTGAVRTVRVGATRARVGSRVAVVARRLADGTFRASRVRVTCRAAHARVRAVLVHKLARRYLVSAGGSVLSIRRTAVRRTASVGSEPNGLQAGDVVEAEVDIENGDLNEDNVQEVGQTSAVEIEGKVLSLSPLQVSVEGLPVTITVPSGVTLPASLHVGDRVELVVSVAAGNVFTLVSLKDENEGDDDNEGTDVENERVEVEGTVASFSATQLVVRPGEHASPVTFVVPAGFDLAGLKEGVAVEAKGTLVNGTLTLTKLELKGDDEGDGEHDDEDDGGSGSGSGGGDDHGGSGGDDG